MMGAGLSYDMRNPPAEPPGGADRLVWAVSYALHQSHRAGPDGRCISPTCETQPWPCDGSRIANAGLMCAAEGYPLVRPSEPSVVRQRRT